MIELMRYAVLGVVLREGPIHGYAVAEELRRLGLGDGGMLPQRPVYRALEWLDEKHLVVEPERAVAESASAIGSGGRGRRPLVTRREYEATDRGAEEFETWLRTPLVTEADLAWRVAAARPEDLATLRDLVLEAEDEWMRRVQEHPVTDVGSLLARKAEWPRSRATLLSILRAKQQMGHAQVLRELGQVLHGMAESSSRG